MKTRYWIAIVVLSLLVGSLAFWDSDAQTMAALVNGVVAIASILFGILGAWMSILKPVDELDADEHAKRSAKTDLALEISPALKQATFALAAVVLLRLSLSVVPGIGDTILDVVRLSRPGWAFPDLWIAVLRSLFGACVTFLYIFETVILLLTLLPILSVESRRREIEFNREEEDDPAQRYLRSKS